MANANRNRAWGIQKQHRRLIAQATTCALCGEAIDHDLRSPHPKSPVVDHIVPVSRGGTDHTENKQVTHRDCNARKGTKDYAPVLRRSGGLR